MHIHQISVLLACVACSACGGGGANDNPHDGADVRCDSISGGGSTVTSSGPVSNAGDAADGNLNSFAQLNITVAARTASVRATAQEGVVFPAGSRAGAFVTFLNQGDSNITTVRTYLNGALVESSSPANNIFEFGGNGTDAQLYVGLTTSAPFDAVEFVETDSGSSGNPDYRVYEICSDGHGQAIW